MNQKIARFLSKTSPETPCLVVDLDVIGEAYDLLARYLSIASIYYAVKANPAAEIVAMLAGKGSRFDVASPAEIALCLANGATPDRLDAGARPPSEGHRRLQSLGAGSAELTQRQFRPLRAVLCVLTSRSSVTA